MADSGRWASTAHATVYQRQGLVVEFMPALASILRIPRGFLSFVGKEDQPKDLVSVDDSKVTLMDLVSTR